MMPVIPVPFASLLPPKGNPRKVYDRNSIAGLAQSIRTDGILQNLVVRPEEEGKYRVVFGKRRFLALQLLRKENVIDDNYQVPVDSRDNLSDADALRLATVENVQREPMTVLDEADAFAKLLAGGDSVETVADQTGLSAQTVKRRLALANLCSEAKKALRSGVIGRGLAEALTLGSAVQQRSVLEAIDEEGPPEPEYIRDMLLRQKPSLAMAIFPKDQYEGGLTTDLFADEETTYFDDVDQFVALQRQAVEQLAEQERSTAAWVDVLTAYSVPWWQYRDAEGDEPSGTVIHFHPSGEVEVRKNLARQPVNEEVVQETREVPQVPVTRQKPMFTATLLRHVTHHKTLAVQAALLRDPRKAKEVVALLLLGASRAVQLSVHSCHRPVNGQGEDGTARAEIDQLIQQLADRLGLEEAPRQSGVTRLLSAQADDLPHAVTALPDGELDRLIMLVPILCFGQQRVDSLDVDDSLFNQVAANLGIHMRDWWTPDVTFLSALRRDQLIQLTADCGAGEVIGGYKNWSKAELLYALSRFFVAEVVADDPHGEAYRQGRRWLPGLMRFPAEESLASQAE